MSSLRKSNAILQATVSPLQIAASLRWPMAFAATLMTFLLFTSPAGAQSVWEFYAYAEDENGDRSDVIAAAALQSSYGKWFLIGPEGQYELSQVSNDDRDINFHLFSGQLDPGRHMDYYECLLQNGHDESLPFFSLNAAINIGGIPGGCFVYGVNRVDGASKGLPVETWTASPTATIESEEILYSSEDYEFYLDDSVPPSFFFNRWEVQASDNNCSLDYEVRGRELAIQHRGTEPTPGYEDPDPCFPPIIITAIYKSYQTLFADETAPVASLNLFQNGNGAYAATIDGGFVLVTAGIQNPESLDTYTFDWSATDNAAARLTTARPREFGFDPSGLEPGVYIIRLTVTNDTSQESSSYEFPVTITSGDPLETDENGNGLPDSLSVNPDPSVMLAPGNGNLVTEAGLRLRVGSVASASMNLSPVIDKYLLSEHGSATSGPALHTEDSYTIIGGLFDFEIHDIYEAGQTVPLVLPLSEAIPPNAVYRMYVSDVGWQLFVEDANNELFSASSDGSECPAIGSDSYEAGLIEGNDCLLLKIQDGGPNDADGQENGVIKYPGGVAAFTFTVGGTVFELAGDQVVLQNNGDDDQVVTADGSFTFSPQNDGTTYEVTVATQPTNPSQTCTVTNGSGTLTGTDVTNVEVTCTTDQFTVGGTVFGLAGDQVLLQNNGSDNQVITTDGGFTFSAQDDGTGYEVTVATQPNDPSQTCTVTNGTGTLSGADVDDIEVACTGDGGTGDGGTGDGGTGDGDGGTGDGTGDGGTGDGGTTPGPDQDPGESMPDAGDAEFSDDADLSQGCACSSSPGPGGGFLFLVGVFALFLIRAGRSKS